MSVIYLDNVTFTQEEMQLFSTRVDEGYDLPPTGRYALWLQMYYPGIYLLLQLVYSMYLYMEYLCVPFHPYRGNNG